jgi:hypothetical protein
MREVPLSKTIGIFGAKEKASNTVYFFHELLSPLNTGLLCFLFQYYLARGLANLGDTS